jgi:hypothetical protein
LGVVTHKTLTALHVVELWYYSATGILIAEAYITFYSSSRIKNRKISATRLLRLFELIL